MSLVLRALSAVLSKFGFTRLGRPSRSSIVQASRIAAFLLLLVWIGPVTFVQNDLGQVLRWSLGPGRAQAADQVIPAGAMVEMHSGALIEVRMHDGRVIRGRFRERALLDSAEYAPRYEAYARTQAYVPLDLGDSLRVTLRDGREWHAAFLGYAELALLMRFDTIPTVRRAPFESILAIQRENGERVDPQDLVRAFRARELPSAEAMVLEGENHGLTRSTFGATGQRIAIEDIATVRTSLGAGGAGEVVGIVVVSAVLGALLALLLLGIALDHAFNDCGSSLSQIPFPGGFTLTTRPFDRSRGTWLGDSPLLADADPAPAMDGGHAGALAAVGGAMRTAEVMP